MQLRHSHSLRRSGAIGPALLLAAVCLCYLPGFGNEFLWIDHSEIVEGSMLVTEVAQLPDVFLRADNAAGYHRPIYRLIHTLDHAIWGLEPFGYYLSSLLLHAVNILLLFLLLQRSDAVELPEIGAAGLGDIRC